MGRKRKPPQKYTSIRVKPDDKMLLNQLKKEWDKASLDEVVHILMKDSPRARNTFEDPKLPKLVKKLTDEEDE